MRQERGDFCLGHFTRMSFPVKQNVALDPVDVGLLRADAEMFSSNHVAHLI
jgi:hypothetical protein